MEKSAFTCKYLQNENWCPGTDISCWVLWHFEVLWSFNLVCHAQACWACRSIYESGKQSSLWNECITFKGRGELHGQNKRPAVTNRKYAKVLQQNLKLGCDAALNANLGKWDLHRGKIPANWNIMVSLSHISDHKDLSSPLLILSAVHCWFKWLIHMVRCYST